MKIKIMPAIAIVLCAISSAAAQNGGEIGNEKHNGKGDQPSD